MATKELKMKKVAIMLPIDQVLFVEKNCYSLPKLVRQMLRDLELETLKREKMEEESEQREDVAKLREDMMRQQIEDQLALQMSAQQLASMPKHKDVGNEQQ